MKKYSQKKPIYPQHSKDKFIRLPQVLQILPISKCSFYNGIKSGKYPNPTHLGPRISVWRESDIMAIVEGAANEPA